jgi:hypothetical protein
MPKIKDTSPRRRSPSPSSSLSPSHPLLSSPAHPLLDEIGAFIMSATTSQPHGCHLLSFFPFRMESHSASYSRGLISVII